MRILWAAMTLLFAVGYASAAAPKNVLVLIADDLGNTLGCYGDRVASTPNIDRFAQSATRFDHAFASVASCSPSRATMLTGLPTHQCGQYGLQHATHNTQSFGSVKSLPALLNAAGYYTASIGKLHVGPKEVYPFTTVAGGQPRNPVAMAELIRKQIGEAGEKPFFFWVGYTDPHRAAKGFGNEAKYPADVVRKVYDPQTVPVPAHLNDTPTVRADLADYYQSVSRLDDCIGRALKVLDETGKSQDTLVVFLSDNGIPFAGAKTTLYDAGTRLPLIVRVPGQKGGMVQPAMTTWTDLAPTVLDWAGISQPKTMLGKSWLKIPEAKDGRVEGWETIYGSHQWHEVTMYYPMRTIRTRTHRLILNLAHPLEVPEAADLWESPTWQEVLKSHTTKLGTRSLEAYQHRPAVELYDLRDDPTESKNRADDPALATIRQELETRLKMWQKQTADPWFVLNRTAKGGD